MRQLSEKIFADLSRKARLLGAVDFHAGEIEQAADYIYLNRHYLVPDDLQRLRELTKIIGELSDAVLERIENEKDMKL